MLFGIIEIPQNCKYKYEVDKISGKLVLDKVLTMSYPANYGYIPDTLSEDGDPLDVFVISRAPLVPLSRVKLTLLGVIEMYDNGVQDEKLFCVLEGDSVEIDNYYLNIPEFLKTYKAGTFVRGFYGEKRALKVLEDSRDRYNKSLIKF